MKPMRLNLRVSERGQSLLELALSFVLVVTLLSGAVTFGMGLFYYVAMRDAAQEGALYGSVNPPASAGTCSSYASGTAGYNLCQRVRFAAGGDSSAIKAIYDESDPAKKLYVTVSYPNGGTPCEGKGLTVTLTYNFPIFMPFIGTIIGSDHIGLSATVTDTILTPVCP